MTQPISKPPLQFGGYHPIPNDVAVGELVDPYLTVADLGQLARAGKGPEAFVKWYFDNNPHLYAPQGMPELVALTKGDSYDHTKGRLVVCGQAKENAKELYGAEKGRYNRAIWLGGRADNDWHRQDRNQRVTEASVSITVFLGLAMGLNIAGRSIYNKSFTHLRTWYKRYLLIFSTPPALGIATALTHKWADRQLKDVPRDPHKQKWDDFSDAGLQRAGAYGLMDKEQFVLISMLRELASHLREQRNAAVNNDTDDVVLEWAKNDKKATDGQLEQAYMEGCYRIHSAGFVARGKSASDLTQFSLDDMWPSYSS